MRIILFVFLITNFTDLSAQMLARFDNEFYETGLNADVIRQRRIYAIESMSNKRTFHSFYDSLGRLVCFDNFDSLGRVETTGRRTYFGNTAVMQKYEAFSH